mgnify:CR=1 FL=1
MSEVLERVRGKLNPEEYDMLLRMLSVPPSRIRGLIEKIMAEAEGVEDR